MVERKIIGIMLVQNEDLYIENALSNILEFCDKVIVADNMSSDHTADKVHALMAHNNKIEYYMIQRPIMSHDLISRYAGDDVWIFAVDGDELYDPSGLALMRKKIMEGKFDDHWMIFGNVLNCVELNLDSKFAKGYLAPPCRSMTKLYNFSVINLWSGPCPERLHGGTIKFRPGFKKTDRFYMYKEVQWEDSFFRCLHLCFLPRSSKEKNSGNERVIRKNIADQLSEGVLDKLKLGIIRLLGRQQESLWKREKYMQGELVQKNINSFRI